MTTRGRLRDELRRLGNTPVPVLGPGRAQQLERRVLSAARPRELELVDAESIETRRPSRRLAAVVTLAAACLLAVVAIGSLGQTREPDRILSTSGEVEVVLPDGSVVDGSAGMVVPDGAILRLGRDGEAAVDGITISGAGDYLVTRDGLTLLTTSNPPASTSAPTTGPHEQSTVAAGAPVGGIAPVSTARDPAPTVVRPTTTERGPAITVTRPTNSQRVAQPPPVASVEPRRTVPPSATTSPPPPSVPETTPPPSRPAPPSADPAPLDVTIRTDGGRVVLAWRPVAGAGGYVVAALPAVGDGAGSWPPAPGVEITELNAGTFQLSVSRPAEGSWSYRVAAVGRDGRTMALSRVITIES
jgi:hypothetical protein